MAKAPYPKCRNDECKKVNLVIDSGTPAVIHGGGSAHCPKCKTVYSLKPVKSNPDKIEKEHQRMKAYERAINRIDDFFEYANESESDRIYVHSILDDLAKTLETIYK